MARFLLKIIVFLLVPLLCAEGLARVIHRPDWYETHWSQSAAKKIESSNRVVCFVGSSRTGAAIDAEIVTKRLSAEFGYPIEALNLGLGYSTLTEQYFLIRNLLDGRKSLHNVLLVVEAPHGYPNMRTWSDSWADDQAPEILSIVLQGNDLRKFWTQSSEPIEMKLLITAEFYLSSIRTFNRYRKQLLTLPSKIFHWKFAPLQPKGQQIAEVGGISNNPAAIEATKKSVMERGLQQLSQPCPSLSDQTVLFSLVRLCQGAGGHVCTYIPPHSQYDKEFIKFKDCQNFNEDYSKFRKINHIGLLVTNLATADLDFPDFLHLREGRREEFSEALSVQLEDYCKLEQIFTGSPPKPDTTDR